MKKNMDNKKARLKYKPMEDVVLQSYNMEDKENLHDELVLKFGLPEFYGRNLDAFYDMMTEWSKPVLIVLFGEKEIIKNLGDYGKSFIKVLKTSSRENPNVFFYSEDRIKKMKMKARN